MKDKILYLILGILIGAVITAGCFLVISKNSQPQMNGERPDMSERRDIEMPEDGDFEKGDRNIENNDLNNDKDAQDTQDNETDDTASNS